MTRSVQNARSAFNPSLLLDRGDATGVPILEQVIERDANAMPIAYQLLARFRAGQREMNEARIYLNRLREMQGLSARTGAGERMRGDLFAPHTLSAVEVESIATQLSAHPEITAAHLVRKEVEGANQPLHVLCLHVGRTRRGEEPAKIIRRITRDIILPPGDFRLMNAGEIAPNFLYRITAVPAAEIYRR